MSFDVIFDIDGTIADLTERRQYLLTKPKNWKAFKAGVPFDTPIKPVVEVLKALHAQKWNIILCSGRGREQETDTRNWLAKHKIPYNHLYIRKERDYRCDSIVKKELFDAIVADGFKPLIVFDDRDRVVDMWRENGLVCAQVAPGDF
jgi:hypothetical protein